jgi:hypothetical protein
VDWAGVRHRGRATGAGHDGRVALVVVGEPALDCSGTGGQCDRVAPCTCFSSVARPARTPPPHPPLRARSRCSLRAQPRPGASTERWMGSGSGGRPIKTDPLCRPTPPTTACRDPGTSPTRRREWHRSPAAVPAHLRRTEAHPIAFVVFQLGIKFHVRLRFSISGSEVAVSPR